MGEGQAAELERIFNFCKENEKRMGAVYGRNSQTVV